MHALLIDWLPAITTLVIFSLLLSIANWALFKRVNTTEHKFPRQLAMLLLSLVSVVALVISLPINESTKAQVLSLIGLLISGLLAFSSTTIFSNLMAGVMMRFTEPFRTGDFVHVQGYFGRVTERGLLDCELQTEDRDLISIPNNMMVNNAIKVVRSSGTITSLSLTLGYDVHHSQIETLLKKAATQVGLEEPFVYVTELGNFAVAYKIGGMLSDVKSLLTTRSNLHKAVLDSLHGAGIEIMSPSVMNQRKIDDSTPVIARPPAKKQRVDNGSAEQMMFDKAEEAEQKEKQQQSLKEQLDELQAELSEADKADKEAIKTKIAKLQTDIDALSSKELKADSQ